jgi:hypothetical protein
MWELELCTEAPALDGSWIASQDVKARLAAIAPETDVE